MRMEIYRYKFPLECYYAIKIKALRIKAEMENQLMARGRYVW